MVFLCAEQKQFERKQRTMSTPTDREKISEKLQKEWEKIDDETLVKEIATKGKFINLLLSFLSRRNEKTIGETRAYFDAETDKYVYRLLSNRQVHKAELVLSNVNRDSRLIFYEFAMNPSATADEDVKEHILEHLQKSCLGFDLLRDEYDYYLLVLKLVAANKVLKRQFESEIKVYTLEALYAKSEKFRQRMAVVTCFHCKNAMLVEKLDKLSTWHYFWSTNQIAYLVKWLDCCFINRSGIPPAEAESPKKEICFDVALRKLFLTWEIDETMFETVQMHDKIKDIVLNAFAKNGLIFDAEHDDGIKMLQRAITTASLDINEEILLSETRIDQIVNLLIERDEWFLLMEPFFTADTIDRVRSNSSATESSNELDLCVAFKRCPFDSQRAYATISKAISEYIIHVSDADFYSKMPYILLCEQMLSEMDIRELADSEAALPILSKISFIDIFFRRLRTLTTLTDHDTTLTDLLRLKNIDLPLIRSEIFRSGEIANDEAIVSFSNSALSQKYSQPTTLNYIDYVRLHRSSYAVYKFLVAQLQNYSQISKAQIQIASGSMCELAVTHLDDQETVAHCVAFVEMLGVNSQVFRAYLQCLRLIKEHANVNGEIVNFHSISVQEIITRTERILLDCVREMPSKLFDARLLEPLRILCRAHAAFGDLPLSFLQEAARTTDWFQFLLFASYQNYSIRSIINVCQMKCFLNQNIGLNIGRSLKEIIVADEMPIAKRTASFSYREHRRKIQNRVDAQHLVIIYSSIDLNSILMFNFSISAERQQSNTFEVNKFCRATAGNETRFVTISQHQRRQGFVCSDFDQRNRFATIA